MHLLGCEKEACNPRTTKKRAMARDHTPNLIIPVNIKLSAQEDFPWYPLPAATYWLS
jgi:hypothetical protein